jgi:prefoldin alpha subunit
MAKSRGDIEADIQNLLSILQNTREQAEELRTQGELLRISLEEHRTAIETLESYKDVKEGDEVLVPVGANAYLFANSSATKSAVTELGAGLSAALPIPVAVEKLRKRIEKIGASRKRVLEGGAKLENSAASLEQQVQGLYQQLQTGEAPGRPAKPASSGAQSHAGHAHTGHAHAKNSKHDEDDD